MEGRHHGASTSLDLTRAPTAQADHPAAFVLETSPYHGHVAIRIPYGLRNGSVVHIRDVTSGLSCQCVCLNCGGELIARKGAVRQEHFAHRSGLECAGLAEGVLHRIAKEFLYTLNRFDVPAYVWERSRNLPVGGPVHHKESLSRAGPIRVCHAWPEFRMPPDFIPDVVLVAASGRQEPKPLFVEIVVSNRVNKLKQRKIRRFGVPTIEIRLVAEDLALSPEEMRSKLQGLSKAKRWVFHPRQIACEKAFVAEYRRRRPEAMKAMRVQLAKDVSGELRNRMQWKARTRPTGTASFERAVERFHAEHHRYPSLQETRTLWKQWGRRE